MLSGVFLSVGDATADDVSTYAMLMELLFVCFTLMVTLAYFSKSLPTYRLVHLPLHTD